MSLTPRYPLNCFKCEKELELPDPRISSNPYGAVFFTATGNYGSTCYDPLSGLERLGISLCDECVVESSKLGLIYLSKEVRKNPEWNTEVWDFYDDTK